MLWGRISDSVITGKVGRIDATSFIAAVPMLRPVSAPDLPQGLMRGLVRFGNLDKSGDNRP
jgi:hypothetical protein